MTISKPFASGMAAKMKEGVLAASLICCVPAYASFLCRLAEEITGEQLPASAEASVDLLCTMLIGLGFASIAARLLRRARSASQEHAAGTAENEPAVA